MDETADLVARDMPLVRQRLAQLKAAGVIARSYVVTDAGDAGETRLWIYVNGPPSLAKEWHTHRRVTEAIAPATIPVVVKFVEDVS